MSRKFVVASPEANVAKKVESFSGKNFGDLKRESTFAGLYKTGVDVILNPGNVTLTRDDAELPEGDFKVFLIPSKNKSGIGEDAAYSLGDRIAAAIVEATRLSNEKDVVQLEAELKETIEDFFDVTLSDDCSECTDTLEEAHRLVDED